MKILVLSHTSDLKGGAERSMLDVFDSLAAKHDIHPEFILREPLGSMVAEMKKRGWKYHSAKYTFWSWPGKPTKPEDILHHARENAAAIAKIEKIIKKVKPDVLITNTIISPWGALAAYFQNVPHIWFVREYGDLDHDREFDMSHKDTYEDVGSLSNLVVGNSQTIASHIAKYVNKDKISILYNPFNIPKMKRTSSTKIVNPFKHKDSLKLVMTSNVAPGKGQLEAIEAVGQLNKAGHLVELCLVGHTGHTLPAYLEKILAAIKSYGLADKVHMVGLQATPLAYVKLADIGITASRREAFGRTTFDYLIMGKAIVGADSGATPEMVQDGVNGYLYKPGDIAGMVRAITHYLKNPELLKKHGRAGEKLAAKMMAGPHNIDALYEKIALVAEDNGAPKGPHIHYLEQWPGYNPQTHKLIKASGSGSVRQKARWHARQIAKNNYYRARKLKAKLIGR